MRPSSILSRWEILELAEEVDRRQTLRRRRQNRYLQQHVFQNLSEVEFVKNFRLGKIAVRQLADDVLPLLPKKSRQRRDGIAGMTKLLIALAFYATGSYQSLIGQTIFHNVSQATVSRAVRQVTEALNNPHLLQKYVHWPTEREERNQIKAKFKCQIPGVIGCIDGTHVAIRRPHIHEEHFYNRKGYHSLNVMIICDADLMITCVDANSPGAAHDSSVWQSHPLSQMLSELTNTGEQVFLLGDSGYALQKTLITPILNTVEGTPEHHFYNLHVSAHNLVKRCICMLKARFRCLLATRALHYDPITAGKIVNACCVLHNIAHKSGAAVTPLSPEELEDENRRQCQVEHPLSHEVAIRSQVMEANGEPLLNPMVVTIVEPDLRGGQALQQALIDKLWQERI